MNFNTSYVFFSLVYLCPAYLYSMELNKTDIFKDQIDLNISLPDPFYETECKESEEIKTENTCVNNNIHLRLTGKDFQIIKKLSEENLMTIEHAITLFFETKNNPLDRLSPKEIDDIARLSGKRTLRTSTISSSKKSISKHLSKKYKASSQDVSNRMDAIIYLAAETMKAQNNI